MTFGALLRRLRIAAGLSQEALAERARISGKAVGALETGARRAPYRETLEQLLDALGATSEERAQLSALAEAARSRKPRTAGQSAEVVAETLPVPPTRLIGRTQDVAAAADLLERHRLVTLVGPGGVGKTRTAIEVARAQRSRFPDGAFFVDLAALSDLSAVMPTIGSVLGTTAAQTPTLESLADALRERRVLIVLDNCEHVLQPVTQFARALLRRAGAAHVLATSREPLGTDGEIIVEIPALQYPPREARLTIETAMRYAAVELFCERAASRDRAFALTDDNCAEVARIVRRLDGIPLGIELAAARVRAIGIAGVESGLSRRFELLAGGDRAAPTRQQTMHALIAWSYDLLEPTERRLLRNAAVFAGSWSLAAAEAVSAGDAFAVLPTLASLVEKSLVARETSGEASRYRLLESTRDFARDARGAEEAASIGLRHAHWVYDLLRSADERVDTESASKRLAPLFADMENIRAALQWCDTTGEAVLGADIACRTPELFYWYGFSDEGRRWIEHSLLRVSEDDNIALTARLYAGLARLSSAGDANRALEAASRAVDCGVRAGDDRVAATAHTRYAVALYLIGRLDEAFAANDRACELLRQGAAAQSLSFAWALQHRSWMLVELGRFDEARACIEQAIAIFRLRDAPREAWGLSGDLAELEFAAGNAERALEIIDEAIPVAEETEDPERASVFTCNRAGYLLRLGDYTEAEATARDAVALAVKTHSNERVEHALEHLAAALASRGDIERAALLGGFVTAGYAKSGYERESTERSSYDILVAALRGASGTDIDVLGSQGAELTMLGALEVAGVTVGDSCRS